MTTLQEHKTLFIFEGIALIILGILAIALPVFFTIGIELLIGCIFVVGGIFQGVRAFNVRHVPGFTVSLLTALLYLVIGILLLLYPLVGVLSLTMVLTCFFILEGIAKIIWGVRLRPASGWGWMIVSGILALIMAGIIIAGWPGTAFWVIGLLVGIDLLFFGSTLIALVLSEPRTKGDLGDH